MSAQSRFLAPVLMCSLGLGALAPTVAEAGLQDALQAGAGASPAGYALSPAVVLPVSRKHIEEHQSFTLDFYPLLIKARESNSYNFMTAAPSELFLSVSANLYPPGIRPNGQPATLVQPLATPSYVEEDVGNAAGFVVAPAMSSLLLKYLYGIGGKVASPISGAGQVPQDWCHSAEVLASDSPPSPCPVLTGAEAALLSHRLQAQQGAEGSTDSGPGYHLAVRNLGKSWNEIDVIVEEVTRGAFRVRPREFADEASICEETITLLQPSFWIDLTLLDLSTGEVVARVDERRGPAKATPKTTLITVRSEERQRYRTAVCESVAAEYASLRRYLSDSMEEQATATIRQMLSESGLEQGLTARR